MQSREQKKAFQLILLGCVIFLVVLAIGFIAANPHAFDPPSKRFIIKHQEPGYVVLQDSESETKDCYLVRNLNKSNEQMIKTSPEVCKAK